MGDLLNGRVDLIRRVAQPMLAQFRECQSAKSFVFQEFLKRMDRRTVHHAMSILDPCLCKRFDNWSWDFHSATSAFSTPTAANTSSLKSSVFGRPVAVAINSANSSEYSIGGFTNCKS